MEQKFFLKRVLSGIVGLVVEVLAPQPCPGCGVFGHGRGGWCESCFENLPWFAGSFCRRCGRPLGLSPGGLTPPLCGDCFNEPPFDNVRSACFYEGVVAELIVRFKYSRALYLLNPLGEILLEGFRRHFGNEAFHFITPVPLHRERLKERGYNQSALLAGFLAKRTGIPVNPKAVIRRRNTIPQVKLSGRERRNNLIGAFAVSERALEQIRGRSILLIDDVVTTGTTLVETAKVLKRAGAARVCGLTVARSGHS
ncbi:ComF family protein [Thermodesulforhabdus norvegica]|uniref:ComF family protein n=1 Tax=Thermodesulforhabdus norvegica TaxID=39841 RepID=A0A1I4WAQ5_9BACT|nr:ComF family protein [Thermodesulforhabdus norvegica]SFN10340.1 comF family protein [Thermodesulforhabdus norvegica]